MNRNDLKPELKDIFIKFIYENGSEITGALVGLILAILIFTIGIFKTLVILVFMVIGILVGNREDLNEDIVKIINRFIN